MELHQNSDSLESLKLRRSQLLAQIMLRTENNLECSDLRKELVKVDFLVSRIEQGGEYDGRD